MAYTVTLLTDTGADGVSGELRYGISSGVASINFAVSGTITLTSNLPEPEPNITINAFGQDVVIDGAEKYSAFGLVGYEFNMSYLTIQNCSADNGPALNLSVTYQANINNCMFLNNTATENCGAVNISGGGVDANEGTISFTDCTFAGNSTGAGDGGAVGNTGHIGSGAAFINCTFTGNTATSHGGAIHNDGYLEVYFCTFTGNTASDASGAIGYSYYGNTSGISIYGSILYGDTSGELNDGGGTVTYNNVNYCDIEGGFEGATNSIDADPLLGVLQNNGGFVKTMALGSESPCIGASPSRGTIFDARGYIRPDHASMGAYDVGVGNTGNLFFF